MYIRLDEVGPIDDPAKQAEFDTLRRQLNELSALDYERVNKAKSQYLHLVYERQGKAEMTSEAFRKFAENNDYWLNPYAAWSVLRDRYSTADMNAWEEFAVYDEERIARFISQNRHDIDYYRFVQFHLDKQLREVRDYAASRGVVLKGDIPIGISRCSVDAWLHPELFNLDCSAGAPPDDFATLGQNWGFPTQMGRYETRRLYVVEKPASQNGRILLGLQNRPSAWIFPYMADTEHTAPRIARHFLPCTST